MATETASAAAAPSPFEKSLSHLSSYPVVSSAVSALQSYPLAQTAQSYIPTAQSYLAPFQPIIQKATSISQPLVSKADDLADSGLGKVDEKWPIVKETPEVIRAKVEESLRVDEGKKIALGLLELGQKEKEYVFKVYEEELKKNGESGYIPMAKASISTSVALSTDIISWIASYLANKKPATETKDAGATTEKTFAEVAAEPISNGV